jgi:DNA-directed RNA polymerase alpha subunit
MTERNIYVMDLIVSKMAEGVSISKALKLVYHQRNVRIPYNDSDFDVSVMDLGLSSRATNALLRTKLRTLGDVVEFCNEHKITEIVNLGKNSGIEIFEAILDYRWKHMDNNERTSFLIDTVKRNQDYIRAEIA